MIRIFCHALLMFTVVRFANAQGYYIQETDYLVTTFPKTLVAQKEDHDVVLDCRDEGPRRAPVVWTSPDGVVLPSSSAGRVILNRVRPDQAGRYECRVARRKRGTTVVGNASQTLVLVVEPAYSAQCANEHARCRNNECLAHARFCDGRRDCADRSDELNCKRARKRSFSARRQIVEYYGDEGEPCQEIAWSQCNKKCKQYKRGCRGDFIDQPKLYYRLCSRAGIPCTGERTVVPPAIWSTWSEWSECSQTCGEAVRQRTRTCSDPSGRCKGLPAEQEPCSNIPCPVDGGWSEWSDWTLCTELGSRTRERQCAAPPPLHGGRDCVGVYLETQECHVCANTVHLTLSPGRVSCTVGRPTTFVCEYCSHEADKSLAIEMDTEPSSSKGTSVHDNMREQSWSGPCLRRHWTIKLNNDHERVTCALKDSEDSVVGRVTSTIKIRHGDVKLTYAACPKGQVTCKDKRCIDDALFCNGYNDCGDNSDEINCALTDQPNYYTKANPGSCRRDERFCSSSQLCIPESLANEEGGQQNWSSECGKIATGKSGCVPGQFCCASRQCMTPNCQCDGVNDCGDWSDEIGCQYIGAPRRQPAQTLVDVPVILDNSGCFPEEIRCRSSKKCILKTQVCDGVDDCDDRSDEDANCSEKGKNILETRPTTRAAGAARPVARHCKENEFLCDSYRCLNFAIYWCDGTEDCVDGSDEKSCAPNASDADCTAMQFTCADKQCIPLHLFCDGISDCLDETDEHAGCEAPKIAPSCKQGEFKCSTVAACIDENRKCDGKRDCPDASDESACADDVLTNDVSSKADYDETPSPKVV